jgi:Mn2+/Fe2+ NRAMP family transporter
VGQGVSEVLPFAVGIAIVPVPIIAVILMLFSQRAKVNGPLFVIGWVVALALVFLVVYGLADAGDVATDSAASDTVSWGKIVLGSILLLMAARTWRGRPAPGATTEMPKWMAGIDELAPAKALALGAALCALNPKNLILIVGAATGVAQLGLETTDAVVTLIVFVLVASLSVLAPVAYFFTGGEKAKQSLDELKAWLGANNAAVMTVLLLVFGVVLISKGLGPLTA